VHAGGRWARLLAGGPGRRSRLRAAQVALGAAVAAYLPDELAPSFLTEPLARRRAIEAELGSRHASFLTEPLARRRAIEAELGSRHAPGPGPAGSDARPAVRSSRSARTGPTAAERVLRALDAAAEAVRHRLARRRLKAVDAQLGVWATGLGDLPVPELDASRRAADRAQHDLTSASAELAASGRMARTSARLAVALAVQAVVDLVVWVAAAIAAGAGLIWSWLVAGWVAVGRRFTLARAGVAGWFGRARGARPRRRQAAGSRRAANAGHGGRHAAAAGGAPPASGRGGRHAAAAGGAPPASGRGGRHATAAGGAPAGAVHGTWMAEDPGGGGPNRHERDPAGWSDTTDGVGAAADGEPDVGLWRPQGDGGEPGPSGPSGGAGYWWTSDLGDPAPASQRRRGDDDTAGWTPGWAAAGGRGDDDTAGWTPGWAAAGGRQGDDTAGWAAAGGHAAAAPRPRDPVAAAVSGAAGRVARPLRRVGRWIARWLAPVVVAVAAPPDRARRPWLGFARPVAAACVLSLVIGMFTALPTGVVMAGSVKAAGKGLPDLADLRPLDQPERTEVYDVNGKLIEVLKSEEDRIVVPLAAVPVMVQNAVVAAEDARFYDHKGVDQRGILRALFTDIAEGARSQGGSTITQQLVRNAYPQLKERSLARKVKEAALAAELERRKSKPRILEDYLNRVYFGGGYYGIEAASRGYFSTRVGRLSLAQAATLAGIIRSPETANPRSSSEEALRLRNTVLARMVELGLVPADQAARASREPLGVKQRKPLPNGRYRWFMDGVKRQLLEDPRLGRTEADRKKKLFEGGLRIFTTLNPKVQQDAERAVRGRGPSAGPDIALVAMIPSTGAVRAVVGGRDRVNGYFNLALQGRRQAGSAFKPFVLASALENGISPDSVWDTSGWPTRKVCGAFWKVSNYEGKGGGQLPVRVATWLSVNGVYGRLMEQLCPEKVVTMARHLGVQVLDSQAGAPSIALGAADVYPIDMAAAYATFANMGVYHKPNFVTKVVRHGQTLFENKPSGEPRVPPALAYEVNDVLRGVIDHGTAGAARIGRPAAGKTGTTQDYRDAWFVGYTPQLATAVWMGYPKRQQSMRNIEGFSVVTGGSLPARIWHDFMQEALAGTERLDWQRPEEGLQYTVLPPATTTTTQTTIPGQPPGTILPGPTFPTIFPPTTVIQRAPVEPRRLAESYGWHRHRHHPRK